MQVSALATVSHQLLRARDATSSHLLAMHVRPSPAVSSAQLRPQSNLGQCWQHLSVFAYVDRSAAGAGAVSHCPVGRMPHHALAVALALQGHHESLDAFEGGVAASSSARMNSSRGEQQQDFAIRHCLGCLLSDICERLKCTTAIHVLPRCPSQVQQRRSRC